MGLNSNQGSGMVYLDVANGKLVRSFKEPQEGTVERINKKGNKVHELFFHSLEGLLTGIETKENEFGKQWLLYFFDGENKYLVRMTFSSRYSGSFLKQLPNIEMGKAIKFMPWQMKDKLNPEKMVSGVTVWQEDGNGLVKIKPAYTKDERNGLPEMVKIKVKGKEQWDDTDMMDFLEEMAKKWQEGNAAVIQKVVKDITAPKPAAAAASSGSDFIDSEPIDDLPF